MGRYEGKLIASWGDDGRCMELFKEFAYIDRTETRWDVPAGAKIDGASIPRILWTVTGSPYTGKYRNASVVHDFYCSVRTRASDATHRMFHEAMLVSGVSPQRAAIMYAAVRYAGPRWSLMDIHNANLASGGRYGSGGGLAEAGFDGGHGGLAHGDFGGMDGAGFGGGAEFGVGHGGGDDWQGGEIAWTPANVSAEAFETLAGQIDGGMGLSQIDAAVERCSSVTAVSMLDEFSIVDEFDRVGERVLPLDQLDPDHRFNRD